MSDTQNDLPAAPWADATLDDRRRAFLLGLRELTLKHGVVIWGCGCCGSPNLEIVPYLGDDRAGYAQIFGDGQLIWLSPEDEVQWKNHQKHLAHPDHPPASDR